MAERRGRRVARDPLGLRRALSDRLLPGLVAAMALLAALALAGAEGADRLADRWQAGAAAAVTAQVPDPTRERMEAATGLLRADPAVASAAAVDPARVGELLRPWLGEAPALVLPGVVELRLAGTPDEAALTALGARLSEAVPGAELESHGVWVARLAALARSVQGVALAVLALVAGVAVAVVAVATRAGLAARREAIGVLHDLGATDAGIAGRFARRVALLAGLGALGGAALAVPALAALTGLALPLSGGTATGSALSGVPWAMLAVLPPAAALIGWGTAQATVRRWLRRMP